MRLVLDASICLSWFFKDERTPSNLAVRAEVAADGAYAPALRKHEVANALLVAERRKRVDPGSACAVADRLADLDIRIDREPEADPWGAILRLAEAHRLTVYDAAYLELAQRRKLPLASLDDALRRAAEATGVALLPAA